MPLFGFYVRPSTRIVVGRHSPRIYRPTGIQFPCEGEQNGRRLIDSQKIGKIQNRRVDCASVSSLMKITSFDPDKSVPKERVVFLTDPPLSDDVFQKFQKLGYADDFSHEKGCLILHNFTRLTRGFKPEVEQHLTQAEESVTLEKQGAKTFHERFIKNVSEATGIPVAEAGSP